MYRLFRAPLLKPWSVLPPAVHLHDAQEEWIASCLCSGERKEDLESPPFPPILQYRSPWSPARRPSSSTWICRLAMLLSVSASLPNTQQPTRFKTLVDWIQTFSPGWL